MRGRSRRRSRFRHWRRRVRLRSSAFRSVGTSLGEHDRPDVEIVAYDELIDRFGDAAEPLLREQVAEALLYKGITLGELDGPDAEIVAYDELIERFGEASEALLREQVAKALFYKGITLGELDRHDAEIAAYDELIERFGAATESVLSEAVNRARAAREQAGSDEADVGPQT